MNDFLNIVEKYQGEFYSYINHLINQDKKLLVLGDIVEKFNQFKEEHNIKNDELEEITSLMQEAIIISNTIYFEIRIKIGISEFYSFNQEELNIDQIAISSYLHVKERFVDELTDESIPTLDFAPFYNDIPLVRDAKNIGSGFEYLNKFLSSKMLDLYFQWSQVKDLVVDL